MELHKVAANAGRRRAQTYWHLILAAYFSFLLLTHIWSLSKGGFGLAPVFTDSDDGVAYWDLSSRPPTFAVLRRGNIFPALLWLIRFVGQDNALFARGVFVGFFCFCLSKSRQLPMYRGGRILVMSCPAVLFFTGWSVTREALMLGLCVLAARFGRARKPAASLFFVVAACLFRPYLLFGLVGFLLPNRRQRPLVTAVSFSWIILLFVPTVAAALSAHRNGYVQYVSAVANLKLSVNSDPFSIVLVSLKTAALNILFLARADFSPALLLTYSTVVLIILVLKNFKRLGRNAVVSCAGYALFACTFNDNVHTFYRILLPMVIGLAVTQHEKSQFVFPIRFVRQTSPRLR